jgi:hypothetical protein
MGIGGEEIGLRFLATDLAGQIVFTLCPDFPFASRHFFHHAGVGSVKIK